MTGLALSGGGIRSASFGLGGLQGLNAEGVLHKFDYRRGGPPAVLKTVAPQGWGFEAAIVITASRIFTLRLYSVMSG